MRYFTFKVFPSGKLELLSEFDDYRSAKDAVTTSRQMIAKGDDYAVRMILAKDQREGERLLTEKREPRPLGEDG